MNQKKTLLITCLDSKKAYHKQQLTSKKSLILKNDGYNKVINKRKTYSKQKKMNNTLFIIKEIKNMKPKET